MFRCMHHRHVRQLRHLDPCKVECVCDVLEQAQAFNSEISCHIPRRRASTNDLSQSIFFPKDGSTSLDICGSPTVVKHAGCEYAISGRYRGWSRWFRM